MTYFFSFPILLLISMLSVLSRTSPAYSVPVYLSHFCPNATTIPENSSYQSSLSSLLSSISLYATSEVQFYSPATSSLNSSLSSNAINKLQKFLNISDPLYGLHLCRGDLDTEVCRECVATAAKFLAKECSRELVAVIWYDECMIRYSNASFFSTMDTVPSVSMLNTQNITKHERLFNQSVNTTMMDLASQASEFPAGSKKFGTKEANLSDLTIYSLVQCTPDLSTTDCNRCLGMAINSLASCCGGMLGGRVLSPSCYVRFEAYLFYNINDTAPTPAPGLPPLPLPPREPEEDKSQIPTVSIVAIVAPIVVSVVLFFLA